VKRRRRECFLFNFFEKSDKNKRWVKVVCQTSSNTLPLDKLDINYLINASHSAMHLDPLSNLLDLCNSESLLEDFNQKIRSDNLLYV
jgi:hypothetical protein